MLYSTFTVGDKDYKARLNARACVDLEKKLGTNPINVFMKIAENNQLPELKDLIAILHASLQAYQHNISLDDTYDIYDEYVDGGKNIMDLVPVILDIFKISGLIPEEVEEETKNA